VTPKPQRVSVLSRILKNLYLDLAGAAAPCPILTAASFYIQFTMFGSSFSAFALATSLLESVTNMSTQRESRTDTNVELWPEWNEEKSILKLYMRESEWLPNKHIYMGKLSPDADKKGIEKTVRSHLQSAEVVLAGEVGTLEEQIRTCVMKAMMLIDGEKELKASKKRALTTTYGTFSLERTGRISEILRYPIR
jgi:hypothetical protein